MNLEISNKERYIETPETKEYKVLDTKFQFLRDVIEDGTAANGGFLLDVQKQWFALVNHCKNVKGYVIKNPELPISNSKPLDNTRTPEEIMEEISDQEHKVMMCTDDGYLYRCYLRIHDIFHPKKKRKAKEWYDIAPTIPLDEYETFKEYKKKYGRTQDNPYYNISSETHKRIFKEMYDRMLNNYKICEEWNDDINGYVYKIITNQSWNQIYWNSNYYPFEETMEIFHPTVES